MCSTVVTAFGFFIAYKFNHLCMCFASMLERYIGLGDCALVGGLPDDCGGADRVFPPQVEAKAGVAEKTPFACCYLRRGELCVMMLYPGIRAF